MRIDTFSDANTVTSARIIRGTVKLAHESSNTRVVGIVTTRPDELAASDRGSGLAGWRRSRLLTGGDVQQRPHFCTAAVCIVNLKACVLATYAARTYR